LEVWLSHSALTEQAPTSAADLWRASWVGFEGIVASGKTTQSQLLAESIRSVQPQLIPEFGTHSLGQYLSRFGSPGMRLTPEGCEMSYIRHLLALASHMQKLRDVANSAKSAVLLDVATLTDAAYALADLPVDVAKELQLRIRSAVNSLIALVQPPADSGVLIYLDCDPAKAAERVERRGGGPVNTQQAEFLVRMHEAYEFLLSERSDVVRVNANEGIDEVAAAVRAQVQHLIP
jgi:thymidylate kinase